MWRYFSHLAGSRGWVERGSSDPFAKRTILASFAATANQYWQSAPRYARTPAHQCVLRGPMEAACNDQGRPLRRSGADQPSRVPQQARCPLGTTPVQDRIQRIGHGIFPVMAAARCHRHKIPHDQETRPAQHSVQAQPHSLQAAKAVVGASGHSARPRRWRPLGKPLARAQPRRRAVPLHLRQARVPFRHPWKTNRSGLRQAERHLSRRPSSSGPKHPYRRDTLRWLRCCPEGLNTHA